MMESWGHHPDGTLFRVWAPTACQVWLAHIRQVWRPGTEIPMTRDVQEPDNRAGGDRHGLYYTYKSWLTALSGSCRPWRQSLRRQWPRGMVVDLFRTNP